MFSRLGRAAHDRRRLVVAAWLALLLLVGGVSGAVGSGFSSEFTLPDVESSRGFDILEERFGGQGSGLTGSIVFRAEQGVADPEVQRAMTAYFETVVAETDALTLVSPYSPDGARQISPQGPEAGRIAYASLEIPATTDFEAATAIGKRLRELAPEVDGLRVEVGGAAFGTFEPPESEILGLAFAIFILILSFGSVLAMGLPIGTAVAGIGVGAAVVTILSNVVSMPDITLTVGVMIGLGVGIDYSLFIVTRFREELHLGRSTREAAAIALDTAGRAVLFAGITVVLSLLGMLLMGVQFVQGLAIGAALTVTLTMVASLTLLPALLGFAGDKLEVTRWRGLVAASVIALGLVGFGLGVGAAVVAVPAAVVVLVGGTFLGPLRRKVPRRAPRPVERTLSYRWSRFVQGHPWSSLLAGTAVLVVLAVPVLSLRLGFADEGNFPAATDTRQAYDLLSEGFGPGFNGPFLLAAELPEGVDAGVLDRLSGELAGLDGVAFAPPAQTNDPSAPTAVLWQVIPTTAPQDEATIELLDRLRDEVLPAFADEGLDVAVTGAVAVQADFSEFLSERLPLFFGVVLALAFLLLMAVFRSVLVPLKAVVMNLLGIAASYGIVVAVFQWGWGAELINLSSDGAPIEPFVPMMMFAIVFGLSMDYEVFLLSRIREQYDHHHDNARAVADGLASTARVITAAAAIMVFIFGSFLLETDRVIKLFGIGLASAVLLDATVIRMLLVPATMELLGDRNWWLPRWLDRILPQIQVEGPSPEVGGREAPEPVGAGADR